MNDHLNSSQIKKRLGRSTVPVVQVFDQIDSTQTYCLRQHFIRPHLVVADHQNQGHGQRGHRFYSPRANGIYMTVTLPASTRFLQRPGVLTAGIGVAVVQALLPLVRHRMGLKWMNDLYCRRRKCGGFLVETSGNSQNQIQSWVIGIGLNLYPQHFPHAIQSRAGYLFDRHSAVSRNQLIARIYNQLVRIPHVSNQLIITRYRQLMIWRHCKVRYRLAGQARLGTVLGVDNRVRLIVKDRFHHLHHLNYQNAQQIRLA